MQLSAARNPAGAHWYTVRRFHLSLLKAMRRSYGRAAPPLCSSSPASAPYRNTGISIPFSSPYSSWLLSPVWLKSVIKLTVYLFSKLFSKSFINSLYCPFTSSGECIRTRPPNDAIHPKNGLLTCIDAVNKNSPFPYRIGFIVSPKRSSATFNSSCGNISDISLLSPEYMENNSHSSFILIQHYI